MPTASFNDLDQLVRRVDEDRWLASRFAPAHVRERLTAIYAVNYEIARIRHVVSEPALEAIRLAWWRDALADIHDGKPPAAHPALLAYAAVADDLPGARWSEIIDARAGAERFPSWEGAETHLEHTTGALTRLALTACGGQVPSGATRFVAPAAVAWGYVEALRSETDRARLPGTATEALMRARLAYDEARSHVAIMPALLFPAFGHVALFPGYRRVLARGRAELPLLARQFKLVGAAGTGRI